MSWLSRRQKYAIYKFWYLLSLVRWYSILTIVVAQYLSALYLLNKGADKIALLKNGDLHLSIFATACIIASGFIINSFYDLEKDTVNRPNKVIFSRFVSQTTSLNFYFFFNTVGVVLSFYVSKSIMLFNFLFSVALWVYSHKVKKKAFFGELSAASLTIAPFFVVVILYKVFSFDIFLYLSFVLLIVLIREVLKDVLSEKGDLVYGYESVSILVGRSGTKQTLMVLMLLTLIPFMVLYYLLGVSLVMGYFLIGELLILGSIWMLYQAKSYQDFKRIDYVYKFILLAGVLSIPLV